MAGLVARSYAQALFDLAQEEKILDLVKANFEEMMRVFSENQELKNILKHPKVSKTDKKELLDKIFGDVNTYVKNFTKLLIDKSRFMHFDDIYKSYVGMYNNFNNIEVAYVQSATKLSEEQKASIKAMLEAKLHKDIELKTKINEDLLAGVRIKIKDEILDNSAATRLERMKEQVVKTTL